MHPFGALVRSLAGMGCGLSSPEDPFMIRKGVPVRVEIPAGDGWSSYKVGKKLENKNEYELFADNGGEVIKVVLKRPAASATFEDFTAYTEDAANRDDDAAAEDFNAFVMKLPKKIGSAIDVHIGNRKVEGRLAEIPKYEPGERLFMVTKDSQSVVDATVVKRVGSGSTHQVTVARQPGKTLIDLNKFNHAKQRFESVAQYNKVRAMYLQEVVEQFSLIEDAITGNRLNCDDQLIYITVLTDKKSEGTAWAGISSMEDLTEHLTKSSSKRAQGMHGAQGVLVRAGPGTGKTVSLQQLTRLVAKRLQSKSKTDVGIALVPMLLSVQRLASYMKRGTLNSQESDLLSAYINVEFTGQTRDLLLQAYEARALVLCIDGVDEAAGLKAKIENLIVDGLNPMGIRMVASSRPEGVRLERYGKFITMDLAPLSDEQQKQAVAFQLKNSKEYDHLIVLVKIGKAARAAGKESEEVFAVMRELGGGSYDAIYSNLLKSGVAKADAPAVFANTMEFFELASAVPVMLSMYVLCLEHIAAYGSGSLPTSRLHLYTAAVRASMKRRFTDHAEYVTCGLTLAKIAMTNHLVQRREFTSLDVKLVLEGDDAGLAMWQRLEIEEAGVPLIKTLDVGLSVAEATRKTTDPLTKYQFKHLSFQESFFAEGLCWTPARLSDELIPEHLALKAQSVWERGALHVLNDRWMLNCFTICGTTIGNAVSQRLGKGLMELRVTEHQIKVLIALSWEPLRGQAALRELTLPFAGNIDFSEKTSAGVASLAALLADASELPNLTNLEFGLPARIGVEAAVMLVSAAANRKKLRFCGAVHAAQISSMSDVDAILVAATLRNCCGGMLEPSTFASVQMVPPSSDASRICVSASADETLASVFKQGGKSASAFPDEMAKHLMLAGFSAMDLRDSKYTTAELETIGYSAKEILGSLGVGSPTFAALKECAQAGLALELVAGPGADVTLEQLRAAEIAVPDDDAMLDVTQKIASLGSYRALSTVAVAACSGEGLADVFGVNLVWAIALNAGQEMAELNFVKNKLGIKSCQALRQFLRFNRTVVSIDLHGNELDNNGVAELARALTFNSKLSMMRLSGNERIDVKGINALYEGVTSNITLDTLVLESLAGSNSQGVPVLQLKGFKPKELIDLSSRRLGPLSASLIARLITNCRPVLLELGLERNPLKAEGMAYIAEMLKTNDDVRDLDLRFCAIHAEGMKALADALKINTSVDRVFLLANQIGYEGAKTIIEMLPHNKSIKYIGAQDNMINEMGKAALRQAAIQYNVTIDV